MEPKDMGNNELFDNYENLCEKIGSGEYSSVCSRMRTWVRSEIIDRYNKALNEADALRKENEELRKDKARLDWLEKHDVWLDVAGEYDISPTDTAGDGYKQTVRAMIDKYLDKESKTNHE